MDRGGILYGFGSPLGDSFDGLPFVFPLNSYQSQGKSCISNLSCLAENQLQGITKIPKALIVTYSDFAFTDLIPVFNTLKDLTRNCLSARALPGCFFSPISAVFTSIQNFRASADSISTQY